MGSDIIFFILIIVLIFLSAVFSSSENAFFSLSPSDKEQLKNENSKNSKYIFLLLQKPHDLLATLLILNNFVNVAIVIISSSLLHIYAKTFQWSQTVITLFEIVVITFFILLFGEVLPKVYATAKGLKIAKKMAYPLYILNNLPPISWMSKFLTNGTNLIQKYSKKKTFKLSSDELEQAIALTKEENTGSEEQKILEGIVKFGNTEVKQIMKSRMEVEAFELNSAFNEIKDFILNAGYSRIPIYKKTLDEIEGVLYIKDLLPHIHESDDFDWRFLIRKPFFVPENKKIDDLLKEFQNKKMHMAIVVDEYGGVNGLVTLEDILEEIIGDITDEFDEEDIAFKKKSEKEYVFEGRTLLIDFYKVIDIDPKDFEKIKGDAETLGGFIVENQGRILRNKEYITINNVKLTVESSDKKRIKSIKVELL
ncbi:MAG: gliding motility-associated protein GldE [Flavobacteriia bacterium]|nr:gliding motility-associated protein GldE [Flavobacteriia bacterium]